MSHSFRWSYTTLITLCCAVILTLFVLGCSEDSTSPAATTESPLVFGDADAVDDKFWDEFDPYYVAQGLPDIVAEFCQDVGDLIEDLADDQELDLQKMIDCFDDLEGCLRRADNGRETTSCYGELNRCYRSSSRALLKNCVDFLDDFEGVYRRAVRDARREGLEDEFLESEAVQSCVVSALDVARSCGGIDID